ncbi:MAG: aspartate aminotransferase family protein [Anaerolineales bacterium]|jgi:acetylornithine aminotransferase
MKHILKCSGYEIVKTDIVRGKGCHLYDSGGRKYVDFEAGVWCAVLGHSHPRLNRTIRRQLYQINHLSYRFPHTLAEATAVELLATLGFESGKCVFLSSGSEAVELGVQMAKHLTERPLLLTFADSYLGAYGSAGRKRPDEWHCFDWSECSDCSSSEVCDPGCVRLKQVPLKSLGGFVFEPGCSSGLVRLPPKGLVRTLVEMVRQGEGLIVVDEVTTGLGRTGAWYGFQHYGFQPDIVAVGKGLGNGYPVSAVAMTHAVADTLGSGEFRHVQSHQDDPMGCAIAKEVVTILREMDLVERSHRVGEYFLSALKALEARHGAVKEVRGRGLMLAMQLEGSGKEPTAGKLYRQLMERGMIVGCNPTANLLRFFPPLTIGEQNIAQLVERLDDILDTHDA